MKKKATLQKRQEVLLMMEVSMNSQLPFDPEDSVRLDQGDQELDQLQEERETSDQRHLDQDWQDQST